MLWTPIGEKVRVGSHYFVRCRCVCGREADVRTDGLNTGKSQGCLPCRNKNNGRPIQHGDAKRSRMAPEYKSWAGAIQRCTNPNDAAYANYGGRGIKVCDRWLESYENFLADMGRKPNSRHSIDRINNDGNYEPGNCRWATAYQQRHNRRDSK